MIINQKTSLKDLGFIVSTELRNSKIEAILVGGAVVSIYTENQYESADLDFISAASLKKIDTVMFNMGFSKSGKMYTHPKTEFYVEFPTGPVAIGNKLIKKFNKIKRGNLSLVLLTPTNSIMDRLSAFYHWNDKQSLDQAVMIAKCQAFALNKIKHWSLSEGKLDQFLIFLDLFKKK